MSPFRWLYILIPIATWGILSIQARPGVSSTGDRYPALVLEEESDGGTTRIRASTVDIDILVEKKRSLTLRLECLHPADHVMKPDQCLVYLVSQSTTRRYPNHDTPFSARVDGMVVTKSVFKNYKETQVEDKVVVPLLSFWDWEVVNKLATGQKVVLILDGEKIAVPAEHLEPFRQMVSYFSNGKGA